MIILGLHFGHDAGVVIVRDGQVECAVVRERITRIKHAIALDMRTIDKALEFAKISASQIDYCAITSTQGIELIIDNPHRLNISHININHSPQIPSFYLEELGKREPEKSSRLLDSLFTTLPLDEVNLSQNIYSKLFPDYKGKSREQFSAVDWIDQYISHPLWKPRTLQAILDTNYSYLLKQESLSLGFHLPTKVTLDGFAIPAFFINHHVCHAASSYYQSSFKEAAIITHDGGNGKSYDSGMLFYGENNKIYPLTPHHLVLGSLYDYTACSLNLGDLMSAGKLMGLSSYGQPKFYDRNFLGNWYDWVSLVNREDWQDILNYWLFHCLTTAQKMGYDLLPFGNSNEILAPINIDIAASTQRLFEENILLIAEILYKILSRNNILTTNLCFSGGAALNCRANQSLLKKSQFHNFFIEPACDDSGLALGAALFCQHNLLSLERSLRLDIKSPYLGLEYSANSILETLQVFKESVDFKFIEAPEEDAAHELANDQLIGWFEGRSEVGPRALGHRSILADPRQAHNQGRVNQIKHRESWRPFAPAVLECEVEHWFSDMPIPSPYMLFTAFSTSQQVPAVTHVDRSARIQTVSALNGRFFRLVSEFFAITGVPMVLNTSFNGRNEPIVETPTDALEFFIDSQLNLLYLGCFKVTHRNRNEKILDEHLLDQEDFFSKANRQNAEAFMRDFLTRQDEQAMQFPQKKLTPILSMESFNTYNIIGRRDGHYAIPQSLGFIDTETMTPKELKGLDGVIHSDSIASVKNSILQSQLYQVQQKLEEAQLQLEQPPRYSKPQLIESLEGYNIVGWQNLYYAMPQSLGHQDLTKMTKVELKNLDSLIVEDSIASVKNKLLTSRLHHAQEELEKSQAILHQTQTVLQQNQTMLRQSLDAVRSIEGSKFWQLRKIWLKLKSIVIRK